MMKKRLTVVLFLFVFALSASFAGIFQLGGALGYDKAQFDMKYIENLDEDISIDRVGFGPEVRINIFGFQLSTRALMGVVSTPKLSGATISLDTTANGKISFGIFDFIIGGGIESDFLFTGGKTYINSKPMDDFGSMITKSRLVYRTGFGVNLGRIVLSLEALFPARGTFSENFSLLPSFSETKGNICLLFDFC